MFTILFKYHILCFTIISYFVLHYSSSTEDNIIDLSKECKNGLTTHYFLTYGMGFVDSTVININAINKNCSITFHTAPMIANDKTTNIQQIIVVESLKKQKNVLNTNDTGDMQNIAILDSYEETVKLFNDLLVNQLFVGNFDNSPTSFSFIGPSPALKITATSARVLIEEVCLQNEMICRIDNTTFCFNAELVCDGNFNCGNRLFYDEANVLCEGDFTLKHLWFISTCFIIATFCVAIFVKCVSKIIPKIPKTFFGTSTRSGAAYNKEYKEPVFHIYRKPIKITQPKSPRVMVNYRFDQVLMPQEEAGDTNLENEVGSHLYSAGKLYRANQKIKRITSNSPIIRNPRKKQYIQETFGREILFLSEESGKRHNPKNRTYFST